MTVESTPISYKRVSGYFADQNIQSVAQALRDGTQTSCELIQKTLESIERLNPILNCFASVDSTGAKTAAKRLDQELTDGIDRGLLHGIPIAIKDIIDVAGQVTTAGSALFQDRMAASDASTVSTSPRSTIETTGISGSGTSASAALTVDSSTALPGVTTSLPAGRPAPR